MHKGTAVRLSGPRAADTAKALAVRLIEMGHCAEIVDKDGVIVRLTQSGPRVEGGRIDFEVDEHDTPDFAAEKALDELEEAGVVDLEQGGYSPEEEEAIRERLSSLGYIE